MPVVVHTPCILPYHYSYVRIYMHASRGLKYVYVSINNNKSGRSIEEDELIPVDELLVAYDRP